MGRWDIKIKLDNDKQRKLHDVWYDPDIWNIFLSIKMMDKLGYSITFGNNWCKIMLIPQWWHITPYTLAHYPLYCGVLHTTDFILGLLVGLLVVIIHLCLLYIGRIYFHVNRHCILSCLGCIVYSVRRFLPWRELVFISLIHY